MQLHKRLSWQTVNQVMKAFSARQASAEAACRWLEISRSRLYELVGRWRALPEEARKDGRWLYARASKSRMSAEVRDYLEEEMKYIRETSPYLRGHYNFAVLSEQCRRLFGKKHPRNSLREWAIREKLYDPKTDSTGKACIRFEMGAVGMLFQHDSSIHAWLPLTKRHDVLILTEDDHSRKVVGGLLVPRDTAWHHLCVVRKTIETYGCPAAYYCDNHSIFRPPEQSRGKMAEPHTQFSRALSALKIGLKFTAKAHPQAKGKIEKRFDYFQRRLPYLCERYKITNLTKANELLSELIHDYNALHVHAETQEIPDKRWQKAIAENRSFLRPIREKTPMDLIFALHYDRYVKNDGTISFAGRFWKVPKAPLRGTVTLVLRPPIPRRPYTEIFVLYKGSTLAHFLLSKGQVKDGSV